MAELLASRFPEDEAVPMSTLLQAINEGLDTSMVFGATEAKLCALAMTDANDILLSDDVIYRL